MFVSYLTVVTDPLGDVLNFIQNYTEKFPEHPVFYQGTYAQALNDAKRELKFLLVYVHSESKAETTSFCRDTLSNPQVVEYINRRMLFWACDESSPEGYRVSHSISARTYPVLVLIALRANKMVIMGRMEGYCSADELIRRMETVVNDNEVWLNQARQERLERDLTQTLRQQQDEAYQMSLRADQEKQRRKQEERDEALRALQAIEAEELAEQQRLENIERLKLELASQVPSEPETGAPGVISIVFKLPTGQRLERRFHSSNTLKVTHYLMCYISTISKTEHVTATNKFIHFVGRSQFYLLPS